MSYTASTKRGPTYTDWMKQRVDSQQGKSVYSPRMSVVEPVFGNIGTIKGLNRFSHRGEKKSRASGSFTASSTISRNWPIMGGWRHKAVLRNSCSKRFYGAHQDPAVVG
nr:transposase [Tamilnaduibacter salinus]